MEVIAIGTAPSVAPQRVATQLGFARRPHDGWLRTVPFASSPAETVSRARQPGKVSEPLSMAQLEDIRVIAGEAGGD